MRNSRATLFQAILSAVRRRFSEARSVVGNAARQM
jgi:hypothetical protein